jgi:hypothetical protein
LAYGIIEVVIGGVLVADKPSHAYGQIRAFRGLIGPCTESWFWQFLWRSPSWRLAKHRFIMLVLYEKLQG